MKETILRLDIFNASLLVESCRRSQRLYGPGSAKSAHYQRLADELEEWLLQPEEEPQKEFAISHRVQGSGV